MSREECQEFILAQGGKVQSSISGKTDYLLAGYILEDGRDVSEGSKYKKAIEKSIKILSEEDFFALVDGQSSNFESITSSDIDIDKVYSNTSTNESTSKPISGRKSISILSVPVRNSADYTASITGKVSSKQIPDYPTSQTFQNKSTPELSIKNNLNSNVDEIDSGDYDLWVNKYRPKSIHEIIGCR